jgi:hypothetical protein
MKMQAKSLILTVVVAGLMLPAAAQTNDSSTPAAKPATINQRKENQVKPANWKRRNLN